MTAPETIFEVEAPIALLTFNRPGARNAMTWAMYDALAAACDETERRDDVRVLVLRGAGGRAFASGTDITQFQGFETAEDGVRYERRINGILDRLERVTKPTIAQIQGVAAGAGCAMAATCDLRVATPSSVLGVPIARTLGNCLTGTAFSRLMDLVGPGRIIEMLYTGRLIPAAEAQSIGLVTQVVADDVLTDAVRHLATAIASHAPLTLRAAKEATRRHLARRRIAWEECRDVVELCYGSADFREGVAAFLAKRPPRWTGR